MSRPAACPGPSLSRRIGVCIAIILAGLWFLASLGTTWARPLQQSPTVPITIHGQVTLERPNSAPPSDPWVVPLVVTFYQPGETIPIDTQLATTDPYGRFTVTPSLAINGLYDIRVKNFHTLRNVKRNVQVYPDMQLDMGKLLEGDANDDNRVRITDFAILRNAYFTDEGGPGFDPRADFDEDNKIRIRDFALLRGNYFATGDIEVTLVQAAHSRLLYPATGVDFAVEPSRQQVTVGSLVTTTLVVDAGTQPIIGADIRLLYDPTYLEGVQSTPGTAFDLVLKNTLGDGELLFSAATLGTPVSGRIEMVTLTFRALRPTPSTVLHFAEVDATNEQGLSVRGDARDGRVQIGTNFWMLYFPLSLNE